MVPRGIDPVLPVCHSGVDRSTLPRPISEFQALNLLDDKFPELFFAALVTHLGLKRTPRIDAAAMQAEVNTAVVNSAKSVPRRAAQPTIEASPTLPDDCVKMFEFLARQEQDLSLSTDVSMVQQQTKFFVDALVEDDLVHMRLNMGLRALATACQPRNGSFICTGQTVGALTLRCTGLAYGEPVNENVRFPKVTTSEL